jgi:choline-glycine betaine transporter
VARKSWIYHGCIADYCTKYGGWLYVLGTFLLVIFCIFVCVSKYGKIRLGGKNAQPEISFFKWFSIVLTSGMAAGLCYWSVAEPVDFFNNPPVFSGLEGGTAQAAETVLRYSLLHWTLHPYAIYTAVGIALGFMYWNAKRPLVDIWLYPLLGESHGNFSIGMMQLYFLV